MEQAWGGEVLRTSREQLVREGYVLTVGVPGERVARTLRQTGREAIGADLAAQDAPRLQDTEVRSGLRLVATASAALVRARVRLACEVRQRGLHSAEGLTLRDWLVLACPDLDPATVANLVRVAQAAAEPVHAPLLDGVLAGGISLPRAANIHRALARIRKAISAEEYGLAVELLTTAGRNPLFDEQDIARIIEELLRRCLPEDEHEKRNKARRELRDVHESSLADGTVQRIIVTFGDDADYQAVRAILMSPLAAPATADEVEATGEEDSRTPGQRRYDAFMTVLRRGVAGTEGQPTTAKAKLIVTIDFETLRRKLSEGGGQLPGAGAILDRTTVSAGSVRRLACDADIIPMVLGGPSEILDQGRAKRLVTPAQRMRLSVRDKGCSIPGCTIPATWCDAHHVIPWARGGRSDLSNYALLCARHHTWVHEHEHTATVDDHGVTWHLR
ncbi:HNH endonuclease signature motif containing protein [Ornithinimicrobium sufpigmenti]|uniref:HNH endonuclease signature motif containing protein n=1 Tax=Ornithinimicrobium sufpigmenti TaxID=2508882 RepID=UPI001036B7E2|nr:MULTISPECIES: HNH endonuclease signature motif containing protein [unclassified Ornithinimicrobium]